jgi:hypothetical protein
MTKYYILTFLAFFIACVVSIPQPGTVPVVPVGTPTGCGNSLGPWVKKSPIPNDHRENGVGQMNNKLYVFTGFYTNNPLNTSRYLDIYDPQTDKWTLGVPTPMNLSHVQVASWTHSPRTPQPFGVNRYMFLCGGNLNPCRTSLINI